MSHDFARSQSVAETCPVLKIESNYHTLLLKVLSIAYCQLCPEVDNQG